jgi:hypothetical protein
VSGPVGSNNSIIGGWSCIPCGTDVEKNHPLFHLGQPSVSLLSSKIYWHRRGCSLRSQCDQCRLVRNSCSHLRTHLAPSMCQRHPSLLA